MHAWLRGEADKRGVEIDLSKWEDKQFLDCPQQSNCHDCGVFACQAINLRALGMPIVPSLIKQADIGLLRKHMQLTVLDKSIH